MYTILYIHTCRGPHMNDFRPINSQWSFRRHWLLTGHRGVSDETCTADTHFSNGRDDGQMRLKGCRAGEQ